MVADSVVDNFPDGKALALRQDYRRPVGRPRLQRHEDRQCAAFAGTSDGGELRRGSGVEEPLPLPEGKLAYVWS